MSTNKIIDAIQHGNRELALRLIASGHEIDAYDTGDETLVEPSEGVEARRTGRTPLIVASELGDMEYVAGILRHKVKVDRREKTVIPPKQRTALSYAAEGGHVEIVEMLLERGANPNSRDSHIGDEDSKKTPLHYACEAGVLPVVETLIRHGADINAVTKCNATPVMAAIDFARMNIVSYLLAAGARLDICDINGADILTSSIFREEVDLNLIKSLIEHGAKINGQNGLHNPPLLEAIACHHANVVSLLLESGADVNGVTFDGFTALMYAVLYERWDICETLLKHGAKVDPKNRSGQTAMDIAIKKGLEDQFFQLLSQQR